MDLTVCGAGIFGLSIAFRCLKRGARVRLVDPGGPGAGASGGIVGALAPHTPDNWNAKKAFQFRSLVESEALWAEVAALSGQSPGYARTGRLQPLLDDRAVDRAKARATDAALNWGDDFQWEIVQAADPAWAPVSPVEACIHDTLTARIHPARACDALATAIRALGGEIVCDAAHEGQVIHATGWTGLMELSWASAAPVGNGVKGQAVLLQMDSPADAPQIFADGVHIVPHDDGTVAVGSTSEREFEAPTTTDGAALALIPKAAAFLPSLAEVPVLRTWAGVRPRAQSRAPLLGPWPGRPGHFIANGGFKIGFGVAWEVAEVMAELVLEGQDRIPEEFGTDALGLA